MNIIKFNNTSFTVDSYNKSTYFTDNNIISNAGCSIKVINVADLNALIDTPITSISITNTDKNAVIYNLEDINAKIESISEYLNGDFIATNVSLIFLPVDT